MFPEDLDLQLHDILHWIDATRPTRLAVVMDRNTEKHCLPLLTPLLPPHTEFLCMSVVGEPVKSIEHALALWTQLDHAGFDRNSAMIGLGGGTITDLTAFVASTYLRGIPFWLIPTTLLGMVDAAIGGKTGINLAGGKNRIGTFQTPTGISINPHFLQSLPHRQMAAGCAEHAKHLLISGAIDGLEETLNTFLNEGASAEELGDSILQSVGIKAHFVSEDLTERNGIRKTLNFGHTTGHALESWAMEQNQDILHGEAVAWGMQVALKISASFAAEDGGDQEELLTALSVLKANFPVPSSIPEPEVLWPWMTKDKKNHGGKVQMVLLSQSGKARCDVHVNFEQFRDAVLSDGC